MEIEYPPLDDNKVEVRYVRERIRRIGAAKTVEDKQNAYEHALGYMLALYDFERISHGEHVHLHGEAGVVLMA